MFALPTRHKIKVKNLPTKKTMKKLIYIIVFTVVACASLSSCTEEVVKPKDNGGLAGMPSKD